VRAAFAAFVALTRAASWSGWASRNVCGDMESSLARARQLLDQKKNKKIIDSPSAVT